MTASFYNLQLLPHRKAVSVKHFTDFADILKTCTCIRFLLFCLKRRSFAGLRRRMPGLGERHSVGITVSIF